MPWSGSVNSRAWDLPSRVGCLSDELDSPVSRVVGLNLFAHLFPARRCGLPASSQARFPPPVSARQPPTEPLAGTNPHETCAPAEGEIGTDRLTNDVASECVGALRAIVAPVGEDIAVLGLLPLIGTAYEPLMMGDEPIARVDAFGSPGRPGSRHRAPRRGRRDSWHWAGRTKESLATCRADAGRKRTKVPGRPTFARYGDYFLATSKLPFRNRYRSNYSRYSSRRNLRKSFPLLCRPSESPPSSWYVWCRQSTRRLRDCRAMPSDQL